MELRKKILFTLMIIIVFRIGAAIPVPFLNQEVLAEFMAPITSGTNGSVLGYINILSGGSLSRATIFALSITPYINASIIMQLLSVVIPYLANLAKEGEEGRKKMGKLTRYATLILALLQATGFYFYLRNSNMDAYGNALSGYIVDEPYRSGFAGIFVAVVIILAFTAGSALVVWLGEQINSYGIGNGISMLILAGIVAELPTTVTILAQYLELAFQGGSNMKYYFFVPLVAAALLALIWVIVFMNDAERRLPIQYAKRVVGRKVYGGQSTHMPIKVNMSGVLPVIFASTILSLPSTIQMFVTVKEDGFWDKFFDAFAMNGWLYSILYFFLIIAFAYFYTAIQYKPVEMANNLKSNNGMIPGYRPGRPTADYIQKVLNKITLIGALFLAIIAVFPTIVTALTQIPIAFGGTSIIIIVGVALETVRQIESQLLMRHYRGFLE